MEKGFSLVKFKTKFDLQQNILVDKSKFIKVAIFEKFKIF